MFYFWKWSNYDKILKSYNTDKNNNNNDNNININDNNINLGIQNDLVLDLALDCHNKREELDTKLSNRELVFQRGQNPFLGNNYIDDVINRDLFLKPINTNQEKS
jgi:hypothetical protein